ncbi:MULTISPECIES: fatty acid metabolism transcriptional regulator FadR [unclassified Lonepinella]|uniref:fatty acid metabolism transcriptional regulator FadR n=1 Tax=unclassified Lonepinella TaxID=2642006 RepID=UPI003F6E0B25
MTNRQPLLKAQSPAALAEEYIVQSIWNQHFPAGTDLPAERELADKIGVTRTTLREVLQRLAREGWLSIQHGKPTHVNNIWETGGPNIISKIIQLDRGIMPTIIANVVSLRTKMAEYYIPEAVRLNPEESLKLFENLTALSDDAQAYAKFDYYLFRQFTFIANKPVYGLILNSFKQMYHQVAHLFFVNPTSRQIALAFYQALQQACEMKDSEQVAACMALHRERSTAIWGDILKHLPEDFGL